MEFSLSKRHRDTYKITIAAWEKFIAASADNDDDDEQSEERENLF